MHTYLRIYLILRFGHGWLCGNKKLNNLLVQHYTQYSGQLKLRCIKLFIMYKTSATRKGIKEKRNILQFGDSYQWLKWDHRLFISSSIIANIFVVVIDLCVRLIICY